MKLQNMFLKIIKEDFDNFSGDIVLIICRRLAKTKFRKKVLIIWLEHKLKLISFNDYKDKLNNLR